MAEVLVCLLLLTIGLMGLARTQGLVSSMIAQGNISNRVAALASDIAERIRSTGCGAVAGEADSGPVTATWTIEQLEARRSIGIVVRSPGRGTVSADSFRTVISCPGSVSAIDGAAR